MKTYPIIRENGIGLHWIGSVFKYRHPDTSSSQLFYENVKFCPCICCDLFCLLRTFTTLKCVVLCSLLIIAELCGAHHQKVIRCLHFLYFFIKICALVYYLLLI